jgi:soluble lytic murein transglycosylase-like protein
VVDSAPPLRHLAVPDLYVTVPHRLTSHQLHVLRHIHGVRALAVLDVGVVRLRGRPLPAVGVDPATVRGLTPRFTAVSDGLWLSVVRGEMTLSYATAGAFGHALGATLPATPAPASHAAAVALRVGAFASLGLGHAQLLVNRTVAKRLRLRPARAVVLTAPTRSTDGLRAAVRSVLGASARITVLRPPTVSAYARALIPPGYLALYQRAATTCRGLPWTVLAAIGTVESRNGADTRTSSKGARGPMQFLPSTWAVYGVDADGDGRAEITDPVDAVFGAARYLCSWGAGLGGQSLADAVWAYNHADWYVRQVLALAVALS